jgi:Fic family protein
MDPAGRAGRPSIEAIREERKQERQQGGQTMAGQAPGDLFTAGQIAKLVGASDAKVKKAIGELKLKPAAKKGVCSYYAKDAVAKVKAAVAK